MIVLNQALEYDLPLDYMDPFKKPAFDSLNRSLNPSLLKSNAKSGSGGGSAEGGGSGSGGGGSAGSQRKAEDKAAQDLEAESEKEFLADDKVKDPPPPPKPKVRLSTPKWMGKRGAFNAKMTVSVEGELPPESSHLTRVSITVIAFLPDGKQDRIDAQDAHIRDGKASVDVTLWIPNYRDADGKTLQECEYAFKAKHVQSPEIESERIKAGTEGSDTATSSFYLRIQMDPDAAKDLEEKFILESADGSFTQTKTSADDLILGDDYIDLRFTEVPTDSVCSLKIETNSSPPYYVFQNVPFADLDGFVEQE